MTGALVARRLGRSSRQRRGARAFALVSELNAAWPGERTSFTEAARGALRIVKRRVGCDVVAVWCVFDRQLVLGPVLGPRGLRTSTGAVLELDACPALGSVLQRAAPCILEAPDPSPEWEALPMSCWEMGSILLVPLAPLGGAAGVVVLGWMNREAAARADQDAAGHFGRWLGARFREAQSAALEAALRSVMVGASGQQPSGYLEAARSFARCQGAVLLLPQTGAAPLVETVGLEVQRRLPLRELVEQHLAGAWGVRAPQVRWIDSDQLLRTLRLVHLRRPPKSGLLVVMGEDGTDRPVLLLAEPRAHNPTLDCFLQAAGIARCGRIAIDQESARQRQAREARRLQEQLLQMERMRALGEIAGGLVHDFNNVLAIILGHTDLLLLDVQDPIVRESVEVIAQAAGDAVEVVNRVKNFSDPARQRPQGAVDLNAAVRDAVTLSSPAWQRRTMEGQPPIKVQQLLGAPLMVQANLSDLRQVLVNLLLNAAEAMPEGGSITIRTRTGPGRSYLEIEDTGTGMDAETRSRVFDAFFTTKGRAGSGLGMSVAHRIITGFGGQITVDSTLGRGTTITIILSTGEPAAVTGERELPAPGPPDAWRVLAVEDDERLCRLMARMIRMDGHEVVECDSGARALELLRSGTFDVLVTDLSIPDLPGFELAAAAKQRHHGLSVVFVTGWDIEAEGSQFAQADAVVAKPFTLASLHEALASLRQRRPTTAGGRTAAVYRTST